MIVQIPLAALPAQTLTVQLGLQSCRINVRQKTTGCYFDLFVLDAPIVTGVRCCNDVYLVRSPAGDFIGDLYFHDTQGRDNPSYEGLGSRWVLLWDDGFGPV